MEGVELLLQASGGGAEEGEIIGVEEKGNGKASQGGGGGVGCLD